MSNSSEDFASGLGRLFETLDDVDAPSPDSILPSMEVGSLAVEERLGGVCADAIAGGGCVRSGPVAAIGDAAETRLFDNSFRGDRLASSVDRVSCFKRDISCSRILTLRRSWWFRV